MLAFSVSKLFIRRIVVVDIFTTNDNSLIIHCSLFSNKFKGISLEESFSISSLADYPFQKLAKIPVIIVLNGKGVVQKQTKLNNSEGDDSSSLYQGVNEDFYKSIVINSKYAGIAFCRKEHLDPIVAFFKDNNVAILDIAIGNLYTINFFEKFGIENSYIAQGIEYKDGIISKPNEQLVDQDEEIGFLDGKIKKSQYLQFIVALLFQSVGRVDLSFELPLKVKENRDRYLAYKRNFPVFFALVLVLLVMVLFSGNLREKSSLRLANVYQTRIQVEKAISKEKAHKTKSVELTKDAHKISRYFDKHPFVLDIIGKSIPSNIILKTIEINPVSSKLVNNQEVSVRNGLVLIEGITQSPLDVTSWVNQLSAEDWIERVSIRSFTSNEKNYQFELEIFIKDV